MFTEGTRHRYDTGESVESNRKKTPLRKVDQLAHVTKLVESLVISVDAMREQVSRPAGAGEKPEDHRQEQRAAAGVLAKIGSGLDTCLDRYRIIQGRSLPPSLHHEPIPAKSTARAKPRNLPPPSLRPETSTVTKTSGTPQERAV